MAGQPGMLSRVEGERGRAAAREGRCSGRPCARPSCTAALMTRSLPLSVAQVCQKRHEHKESRFKVCERSAAKVGGGEEEMQEASDRWYNRRRWSERMATARRTTGPGRPTERYGPACSHSRKGKEQRVLKLEEAVRRKGANDGEGDETADDAEELFEETHERKGRQSEWRRARRPMSDRAYPGQVALLVLAGHPDVHAP